MRYITWLCRWCIMRRSRTGMSRRGEAVKGHRSIRRSTSPSRRQSRSLPRAVGGRGRQRRLARRGFRAGFRFFGFVGNRIRVIGRFSQWIGEPLRERIGVRVLDRAVGPRGDRAVAVRRFVGRRSSGGSGISLATPVPWTRGRRASIFATDVTTGGSDAGDSHDHLRRGGRGESGDDRADEPTVSGPAGAR